MNTAVTAGTDFLAQLSANVNVGIDEVVAVFVSKWETGLFAKKDVLSKKIKMVKGEIADLDEEIKRSVSTSQYNIQVPLLGLVFKPATTVVKWADDHDKNNEVRISVEMRSVDQKESYALCTRRIEIAVSPEHVARHTQLNDDLSQLSAELVDTMNEIKSVSRKERQIRGKISEMKLEQSGMSALINNAEVLQLIDVK